MVRAGGAELALAALLTAGLCGVFARVPTQAWMPPASPRTFDAVACDTNRDGAVTVDELVQGVNALLGVP